jgi:cytochrome c551/c552
MKRTAHPLILLLAGLAIAGCGSGGSKESGATASTASGTTATPAGGVAAVSKWDSGPRAGEQAIDEAQVERGKALFSSKGCTACHTFGKKLTGPDLAGVSMRRTAAWMEQQILHPEVMTKQDPISHALFATFALQMPNQGLTADEAKAVIEYFKHQDHEAGEKAAPDHH